MIDRKCPCCGAPYNEDMLIEECYDSGCYFAMYVCGECKRTFEEVYPFSHINVYEVE